jgi:hypothetical protein
MSKKNTRLLGNALFADRGTAKEAYGALDHRPLLVLHNAQPNLGACGTAGFRISWSFEKCSFPYLFH